MIECKVVLDDGAYMPERAHETDAGWDLRTPTAVTIAPGMSAVIDTGVHVLIPKGYVGFLKAKSGLNIKSNILGTGVVDAGYTGSIVVKLYNESSTNSSSDYKWFDVGDKIIQLVILPIPEVTMTRADSLEDTERGANGFGSTGR